MSDGVKKAEKKSRIDIIDALRGLAVILMVLHHFAFDLVEFLDAPEWLFSNNVFNLLHYIFAGIFICLCGVSSNFSRSNIKRGFETLILALVISLVTYVMDMPIIFGVLHLLSVCMIFYGFTRKLWNKLPGVPMLALLIILIPVSSYAVNTFKLTSHYLWMFGWRYPGFVSYDYFPVLPWIFVFLAGVYIGHYIKENRFPQWFYKTKIKLLPAVGRHALVIYVIHQPVLFGLTMIIRMMITWFKK